MHQFLLQDVDTPDKEVRIIRNGEKNLKKGINLFLHTKLSLKDLSQICRKRLKMHDIQHFRLFTEDGVELFDQDLQYVQYNAVLYASCGEDYDSSSQFAQYKQIKVIGEGGFGQVVLGVHRVTKQKVAIKYVENNMNNADDIDQVYKEAETMKNLKHKNIVEIYHTYSLNNLQTVLIMEYLEGGELLDLLQDKGRFSEFEARTYFVQMIDAMQYCHNEKLIHRDLKPENIMLAKKGSTQIKVVDFGIAGVTSKFKLDKINIGSLKYMSPEVLANKIDKIGPSIDVWALGVILYAMVCGCLPFDGNNQKTVATKIISGKFSIPDDLVDYLTNEVQDLVYKILEVSVSHRLTLKDIKDHQWIKMELVENQAQINKKKNLKISKQVTSMRGGGILFGKEKTKNKGGVQVQKSGQNIKPIMKSPNVSKRNSNEMNQSSGLVQPISSNGNSLLAPGVISEENSQISQNQNNSSFGNSLSININDGGNNNIPSVSLNVNGVKSVKYNPPNNGNPVIKIQIPGQQKKNSQIRSLSPRRSTNKNQISKQQQQPQQQAQQQLQMNLQSRNNNFVLEEDADEEAASPRKLQFRNFTNLPKIALSDNYEARKINSQSPEQMFKSKDYFIKKFNLNPQYMYLNREKEKEKQMAEFKARSLSPNIQKKSISRQNLNKVVYKPKNYAF